MIFSLITEDDKFFFKNGPCEKCELHEIPVLRNDLLNYTLSLSIFTCSKLIMKTPEE